MKLFIDIANVDEIRKSACLGVLDGVTTSPSLIVKDVGIERFLEDYNKSSIK